MDFICFVKKCNKLLENLKDLMLHFRKLKYKRVVFMEQRVLCVCQLKLFINKKYQTKMKFY